MPDEGVGCLNGLILMRMSGGNSKLITTDAEYLRFRPGECSQQPGLGDQYGVTLLMTVKVINALKVVNVSQGKGVGCPASIKFSKPDAERPPVTGTGQLIRSGKQEGTFLCCETSADEASYEQARDYHCQPGKDRGRQNKSQPFTRFKASVIV